MEIIPIIFILCICLALLLGYSVAFTLSGVSILFALIGVVFGFFELKAFGFLPGRLYGIMENQTLLAVPLFVFMGVVLERSGVAANMLTGMAKAFAGVKSGLSISIVLVGALLAASTGIVGATVVTMGLMSLPLLIKQGYSKEFATGLVASTGTLGQIIPPSIALVLLGDVMSNAYQEAKYSSSFQGTVSVGDLFIGAIVPGLLICAGYLIYSILANGSSNLKIDGDSGSKQELLQTLFPPILLIMIVLGSIILGIATPTEAASIGALGATIIAYFSSGLNLSLIKEVCYKTASVTTMIFTILIGATIFSLIFKQIGGDELVQQIFDAIPGDKYTALVVVLIAIFLFGFILDFIEICYVIIPLVAPPLLMMGFDPIWLGVLLAINLQTSFLTPPFGFSLFYLRGVADESIKTSEIYKGVIPFILIQLAILVLVILFPFIVL
tara:strand:- start:19257 stop:20579 length:1323 start_codon:yes stop_codon:yes gene_type:complete